MFTFLQNKGSSQHRRGVFQHRRGFFQHRRGLFLQGLTKEPLFLHELTRANTKMRAKVRFLPQKRPVSATSARSTLTQPIYPPTGRWFCASGLGESGVDASGLWTFGPKSSVGIGVRYLGDFPKNEKQSLVILAPMVYDFRGQKTYNRAHGGLKMFSRGFFQP
jgi:hypothetical protein